AATTPMSNTSATNQRERIHPPEGALAAGQPPCRRNAATHFEQKADFMDPFVSGARITLLSAGGSCRRTCGSCNRYSTRLRKQSKRRSEPPERDQVRPDTIRKECRRHTNERLEAEGEVARRLKASVGMLLEAVAHDSIELAGDVAL